MKGVHQTILHPDRGNCNAAAYASLLEVPLSAIPDDPDAAWEKRWQMLADWLRARGYYILRLTSFDGRLPGYSIGTVISPGFKGRTHAVVCYEGRIIWDPHPDGKSINEARKHYEVIEHEILVPIDPSKAVVS